MSEPAVAARDSRPMALAVLLAVLSFPVCALAVAIQLLVGTDYVRWTMARPGYPPSPGFSREERLAMAVPSTRFILSQDPPELLAALSHRNAPLYQADEIAHLLDVRQVVGRIRWLALLLATAALALLALRPRSLRVGLTRALAAGGALALGLLFLLGLAILVAWDAAFTAMHRLFFAAGTWQFGADSALIRLFPDRFWYDTALVLVGLLALQSLAALAASWALRPRS